MCLLPQALAARLRLLDAYLGETLARRQQYGALSRYRAGGAGGGAAGMLGAGYAGGGPADSQVRCGKGRGGGQVVRQGCRNALPSHDDLLPADLLCWVLL